MQDILSGRYKQSRMKGSTILFDPQEYIDLAKAGKYWLGKGITAFDEWASKMTEDFGEDIRPKLPTIWAAINKKEEAKSPVKASDPVRYAGHNMEQKNKQNNSWSIAGVWIRIIVYALFTFRMTQIYGSMALFLLGILAVVIWCPRKESK